MQTNESNSRDLTINLNVTINLDKDVMEGQESDFNKEYHLGVNIKDDKINTMSKCIVLICIYIWSTNYLQ